MEDMVVVKDDNCSRSSPFFLIYVGFDARIMIFDMLLRLRLLRSRRTCTMESTRNANSYQSFAGVLIDRTMLDIRSGN